MTGYSVQVFDCAGKYDETPCSTFDGARRAAIAARVLYPDKYVAVVNYDRCDVDTDGLTADEREALDGVAS